MTERELIRALQALKLLWQLLATARLTLDPVSWRNAGGIEAEELLRALDNGADHPALERWLDRRRGRANRPAPSLHEVHYRDLVICLCGALEQVGLSKKQAREEVARRLNVALDDFPGAYEAPSAEAIRGWRQRPDREGLRPAQRQQIIRSALRRGRTIDEVAAYFVPLIAMHQDPRVVLRRGGTEPP